MSAVSGGESKQVLVGSGVRPPLAIPRRLLRMRSDAALAERFAADDEAAFDVIYERHRPVVLAVCMGVLGTPPDAEDATQETFSALAVALRTRPPLELRPWLIRVARNASIDTTRRRRHRLLTLDGELPEVAARPAGIGRAELAVVLDGIRELPEGQRMALLMRELGGHSYAEIAEFLATDEEAVKGLIARARVGLRTHREATELSCAAARMTIAAEPDGRRYDKTIRRHMRGCTSCRAYRDALRGDAKALRAALPIQAGTVTTGGLSSGMLTATKGSLLGYGLSQAATTCAASACAVGAIGGMVLVAPVHKLGLPPILPAIKAPVVHRAMATAKTPGKHRVKLTMRSTHPVTPIIHPSEVTSYSAAVAPRSQVRHSASAAAAGHHKHLMFGGFTEAHPGSAWTGQSAGDDHGRGHDYGSWKNGTQSGTPSSAAAASAGDDGQSASGQGTQGGWPQGEHGGQGQSHASSAQSTQPSTPAPATQSNFGGRSWKHGGDGQSSGSSSDGNGRSGNGNGHWGGSAHGGNPHYSTVSTFAPAQAQSTTAATNSNSAAVTSTTAQSSADGSGQGQGSSGGQDHGNTGGQGQGNGGGHGQGHGWGHDK